MKVRYAIPFDPGKDIAKAYNYEMRLGGADYIAFCDRDTWFPHSQYAKQIERVIERHGEAVYTSVTNRVNCPWQKVDWMGTDQEAVRYAEKRWALYTTQVEDHTDSQLMSGFLIIYPKRRWLDLPEVGQLLGVDNSVHEMARSQGLRVLLMRGIFVWHYYSGFDGNAGHKKRDKSHLL